MGLDFSRTASPAVADNPAASTQNEFMVVEKYDIVSDREQMNTQLVGSEEVDALVSTIEIDNLESIVTFGAKAAEEIS